MIGVLDVIQKSDMAIHVRNIEALCGAISKELGKEQSGAAYIEEKANRIRVLSDTIARECYGAFFKEEEEEDDTL